MCITHIAVCRQGTEASDDTSWAGFASLVLCEQNIQGYETTKQPKQKSVVGGTPGGGGCQGSVCMHPAGGGVEEFVHAPGQSGLLLHKLVSQFLQVQGSSHILLQGSHIYACLQCL